MTVLEFINLIATPHDEMIYDSSRMGFDMKQSEITNPGIYFFVESDNILKVGKADGERGIRGRLNDYRKKNITKDGKPNTKTAELIDKKMRTLLKGKKIKVYVFEIPSKDEDIHGFKIKTNNARALELVLSRQAKDEGHQLHLSGQH